MGALVDAVERAAADLAETNGPAARRAVASSLAELRELLLVHLAYEEDAIGPAILNWRSWPRMPGSGSPGETSG